MNDRFEIDNYEPETKGSLVGKFDLTIHKWGVKILGMCHFKKDNKEWIGFPTFWKQDADMGRYSPAIEFMEKNHANEFKRVVLEELKRAI